MRISTMLRGLAALIVAAFVTALAILYSTDFNVYKAEITRLVREATGRELVIEGPIKPRIGLVPAIAVEGLRFANAPWGSREDMARIASFRAEVELLPLLFGDIRIRQVVLSGADILLESRRDGTGNWVLTAGDETSSAPSGTEADTGAVTVPTIDRVLIEDSVLVWRDGRTGASTTVRIERFEGSASAADAPLRLKLSGSYDGEPIALEGTLGSLAALTSGMPFAIDLTLSGGGAKAGLKGTIARLAEGKAIALAASVRGDDLAALSGLVGTALPAIGPYSVRATVADRGAAWQLTGLALRLGASDLSGTVTIDPSRSPLRLTADLTASRLRMSDFLDHSAPQGGIGTGGAASGAEGDGRIFSADPLPLDGLSAVDLRLSLRGALIEAGDTVLENVALDLTLRDGAVSVKPLQAIYAGGRLAATLSLRDARHVPRLALDMTVSGLDLARVASQAGSPSAISGRLDATATLSGTGRSVRAIMAGLDGTVQISMDGGRLDDRMLEVLSADVLNVLAPGSSDEKGVAINCLVGRYDINGGKLVSRVTVFDTDRLLVAGDGGVDLATERIDFLIVPKAKETSLAKLAVPLRMGGSLAAPTVFPDPAGVAKGAIGIAAGVATGGITTVIGGILSVITDAAKGDVCVAALAAAKAPAVPEQPMDAAPPSAADGVKKAIEGIGEGIGEGIKILLGQ